jgi:UDP-N-acetylglucosamine--N-acetylmuramyl-(pentapeptide) pyrophosphoryl-undecaprenol N-acetylglucosamine transferase
MASKAHPILMVGGGTGGHYMPLLVVAEQLNKHEHIKVVYISDGNEREMQLVHGLGIRPIVLTTGKIRRYLSLKALYLNTRDSFRILRAVMTARSLIHKHKPAVIFTKGGPLAFPVSIAARWTKTPIITHESDAIMGGTNRFIAHFAEKVFTGFPADVYPYTLATKIVPIGIPLRDEFCRPHRKPPGHHRPMILITGGSQGAQTLNDAFAPILPQLLEHASVVHLTGVASYATFSALKESLPTQLQEHYAVMEFSPDIAQYMREATVIVTRAGSTIFELATLGKPMILIPLPWAANNHQVKNAEIFVEHNAALMLNQVNLTPERLYETIQSVLRDQKLAQELKEGTKVFACCDAAKKAADILQQYVS